MKVVVSVDALVPPITGVGRYTWELATRLPKVGGIDRLRWFRSGRWVKDPARFRAEPGYRRQRQLLPLVFGGLYWKAALRNSVFHAPNFFLPPYVERGVVTIHDLSVLRFPEMHPAERVAQYERRFADSLSHAAHVIVPTETVRAEAIERFGWDPKRITAIAMGVSAEYRPRAAHEVAAALRPYGLEPGRYVLFVSTIEPRKGLDALLDAYERMPAATREAYPLVVVGGPGWRSDRLHERMVALGAGWLRYLGFVPEDALPMLYAGAQLFAYPSVYEGFGLPLAEALASGIPTVAANRSCLPETAGGAARLVDADDAEAFAAALVSGIGDDSWRREAIEKGLAVAARYSWDDCAARTVGVYRRVAAEM